MGISFYFFCLNKAETKCFGFLIAQICYNIEVTVFEGVNYDRKITFK
jgi:hypothetical protein